jgi:hypothetical protein
MPFMLGYIDPGTGSLLLQFVLAGLIGGAVFFRNQLLRIILWLKSMASFRR